MSVPEKVHLKPWPKQKITPVEGGKTAREVAEQKRINELGGVTNLENKVNPIGPRRQHIMNNEKKK